MSNPDAVRQAAVACAKEVFRLPLLRGPLSTEKKMADIIERAMRKLTESVPELRVYLTERERKLVEAAQMHANKGHNDTCSLALCGDHYQCDCGYTIAVAALALFSQPVAPKEAGK